MKPRRLFTTSLLLIAAAPFAFGQTTHTPPTPAQIVANQVARLTKLLTLTSSQQGEATTIFTTEQSALAPMSANLKTARTALQTAVQSNDSGTISAQASQIGALTTQEVQAQSTANAAFYAILTPAQQTIYNQRGARSGMGVRGGFAMTRSRRGSN
jgi:Spy/CpxP family protein refolding chaperone